MLRVLCFPSVDASDGKTGYRWVSPKEASREPVRVHESTVTRWAQAGVIVAVRLPTRGRGRNPRWRVLIDEHGFPVRKEREEPAEASAGA
jgi:hypothetical protein